MLRPSSLGSPMRYFMRYRLGVGEEGEIKLTPAQLDEAMQDGAQWAVKHGYGDAADLEYIEERGRVIGAVTDHVSELAKKRQRGEMGTLGSGNHYLEVQVVERIYDPAAALAFGLHEGQIVISIHCGSRGLGHQIGTEYILMLAKAASRLASIYLTANWPARPSNLPKASNISVP